MKIAILVASFKSWISFKKYVLFLEKLIEQ